MHFQYIGGAEDNMLDGGACTFWSNWGSGDAALHWDMTPACLSTWCFSPWPGSAEEQMATKAGYCLSSSREASGGGGSSPQDPVHRSESYTSKDSHLAAETSQPPKLCTSNQEHGGTWSRGKGGQRVVVVWSWADFFSKHSFLLAAFCM